MEYSHSEQEKAELKRRILAKGYQTFHESFVDEHGNPTNGSIIQIIFGSEELKKKSINNKFTRPSGNFYTSISKIRRLIELYPLFYDLHEEAKVEKLRKALEIDDASQQRAILKELLNEHNVSNPIPDSDLAQLEMIYSLRQSKTLLKLAEITEKNRFSIQPNESDKIIMENVTDRLDLHREPEFLNEMIVVYLVTIFKEYLKMMIQEVVTLFPEIAKAAQPEIQIDNIPDSPKQILRIFREYLKLDLEKADFEWDPIEEVLLRRDVLIHYGGYPDKDYKEKTSHVGDARLITDAQYVKDSLKTIEKNQQAIQNKLWINYANPKFLEQMASEDIL